MEVRLIDEKGEQRGVIPTSEALALAEELGLDLVEVAPEAEPPVCKLLDFDKLRYRHKMNQQKARKHIKKQELKEIRLSPNTGDNDINIKANQARKFLEVGDKVKITIQFKGRQITHPELGKDIMNNVKAKLSDVGEIEKDTTFEHRKLSCIFKPGNAN